MLEIGSKMVIDHYINWLDKSLASNSNGDQSVIKTPYKRPDGDFISLRLLKFNNQYYLTDNGDTFDFLFISGN